ncbi:hypothetical protein ACFE04_001323 [Oxalis oulophora]
MQTLLLPSPSQAVAYLNHHRRPFLPMTPISPFSSAKNSQSFLKNSHNNYSNCALRLSFTKLASSSPISTTYTSPIDDSEKAMLAQVSKRLENTARYFKRVGTIGFWAQLVCTIVSAGVLSFSILVTGKPTQPATFYATATGIAAAFISVFWSFGYIRIADKLRKTASHPSKAPPRADVVKSLRSGIMVNLLGLGSTIIGMQATVGLLVAKALTSTANPYYQGISPGYSPVLALDVYLVQASANAILSHFLGILCSLELLRSVTLPTAESIPSPRLA